MSRRPSLLTSVSLTPNGRPWSVDTSTARVIDGPTIISHTTKAKNTFVEQKRELIYSRSSTTKHESSGGMLITSHIFRFHSSFFDSYCRSDSVFIHIWSELCPPNRLAACSLVTIHKENFRAGLRQHKCQIFMIKLDDRETGGRFCQIFAVNWCVRYRCILVPCTLLSAILSGFMGIATVTDSSVFIHSSRTVSQPLTCV